MPAMAFHNCPISLNAFPIFLKIDGIFVVLDLCPETSSLALEKKDVSNGSHFFGNRNWKNVALKLQIQIAFFLFV
jgi:hypothetical protein